ncbi:MAG: exopolysaccharide biosynthesis protein [Pseudomonadota bacterium]
MPRAGAEPFADIIDRLEAEASAEAPTLRSLVLAFGDRGFGALLLLPCLMLILPVGMIPGIPAAAALLLIVIALQMAVGAERLWLPARIANITVPGARLRPALTWLRPAAAWLDTMVRRRFSWFAESTFATETIAAVSVVAAVAVLVVGFVPGLQVLIALPVILFALGLIARNGLVILAGYLLIALPVTVALRLLT